MYQEALLNLIAFCQRENVLSTDSNIIEEVSEICGIPQSEVEDLIYG